MHRDFDNGLLSNETVKRRETRGFGMALGATSFTMALSYVTPAGDAVNSRSRIKGSVLSLLEYKWVNPDAKHRESQLPVLEQLLRSRLWASRSSPTVSPLLCLGKVLAYTQCYAKGLFFFFLFAWF